MTEYYPLLAKAVANLKEPTPESRRALYERARKALLNQLKNNQPPIAPEDIAREEAALDEAWARVEASAAETQAPAAPVVSAPPPVDEAMPALAALDAKAPPSPLRPLTPPPSLTRPPTLRPPAVPPRPSIGMGEARAKAAPEAEAGSNLPGAAAAKSESAPVMSGDGEIGAKSNIGRMRDFGRARVEAGAAGERGEGLSVAAEPRGDAVRPLAPVAKKDGKIDKRAIVFGAALLAAIAGLGTFAYIKRDKPEDFQRPQAQASEPADTSANKIAGRADNRATPAPSSASGASSTAPAPSQPELPVAQRAALLVEAPDEAAKVKTIVGTVVWSLETGANGLPAIRAKAEIAEAKLSINLLISKNTDPKIASTHRIDVRFSPTPNSAAPGIKQIAAIEMRSEDRPQGDALTGLPAKITDNYFWFALAQGDTIADRNIDLMRGRGWLDLPIMLTTDRIAKITLEKGAIGDKLMKQAFEAWGR